MNSKYVVALSAGFAVAVVTGFGLSFLSLAAHMTPTFTPLLCATMFGGITTYLLLNLAGNRKVRTGGADAVSDALAMRPPAGEALIYVYREGFVGMAAGMNVTLDGRPVAQLKSPRFTCLAIAPGAHLLAAGFGGLAGPQNRGGGADVAAVAGGVYVFRCSIAMGALQNKVKVEPVADLGMARAAMGAMKMTLPDVATA